MEQTVKEVGGKSFLHFQIPRVLLERVDNWRFDHRIESRAAAVLRLLEIALPKQTEGGKRRRT
jgi:hypothetical protein